MGKENRVYFKNLSALRFFAAVAVIFHHVEQYKFWAKIPSIWGNTIIDSLGHKAVSFFFVLSGFLITYLLLEENRKTGTISIRDFYLRRVLRIWPVYYLVVALCLFIIPNVFDLSYLGIEMYDEKFAWKAFFLLTVLPNVLRVYSPAIAGGNQLWSIGVEEQFYIIWPFLTRIFVKRIFWFLVIFIGIKFLITIALSGLVLRNDSVILSALYRIWILLKVEQMAVGALGAWMIFVRRESILRIVYSPVIWYGSLSALVLLLVLPFHHWTISFLEAFVFLSVIMNLSTNPAITISLEHPVLTKLGNMSYGIYMYHTICITCCLYGLSYLDISDSQPVLFNVMLYTTSILFSLALAYVSYEYFEKFFLRLKERFMIVKSMRN